MQVIGLTGGVGCGKSTIVSLLEQHVNCLILQTDEIARRQMQPGGAAYKRVLAEFGEEILCGEEIDRKKLAALVFGDKDRLEKLNSLTHPLVTEEVLSAIARERQNPEHDIVLIETALLIEGGYDSFCDQVWYVYASEEDRRRRLMASRGYSEEKITELFRCQRSEEEFRRVATAELYNGDGQSAEEILKTVKLLLEHTVSDRTLS